MIEHLPYLGATMLLSAAGWLIFTPEKHQWVRRLVLGWAAAGAAVGLAAYPFAISILRKDAL